MFNTILTAMENKEMLNTVPEDKNLGVNADSNLKNENFENLSNEEKNEKNIEKSKTKVVSEKKVSAKKTKEPKKKVETEEPKEGLESATVDSNNETTKIIDETTKSLIDNIETKTKKESNSTELVNKLEEFDIDKLESLTLNDLAEILEKTVEEDIDKVKNKISSIKIKFLGILKEEKEKIKDIFVTSGGILEEFKEEAFEVEERFNRAFKIFKDKKAEQIENIEKQKIVNLEKKQKLLDDLKNLIESNEPLKKTYDLFKDIQDSWKQTGLVPQTEVNNLWQNYHFYVEKFFDKVKISRELKELDLKKNLEQKIQLCEKVEELLLETSITKTFKLLQVYHEEWKDIGPVIDEKREEIWERFKAATNSINQRRKEYYDSTIQEQQNNYNAKLVLCEKADEVLSKEASNIDEWNKASEEANELVKIWKTLGQAPKKLNDEVWIRFKTSINQIFDNKKNYLQKIKEQQLNNLNLKINLCVEAEAISKRTDWRKATADILKLQQEWKQIGSIPRKHAEVIWKRFRNACDEYFNTKSEFFSHQTDNEHENLRLKKELIEKANSFEFSDSRNENLNILKDLQRQWTEIGHVPIAEKNIVFNEFKETINKRYDQLRASSNEMRTNNYKNHIDDILNSPDSNKIIDKEKRFLQIKLQKLKEDVALWENNLGFFANSKNAQILKEEFEKKIEAAKKEIENMEQKIALLKKN